MKHKIKVIEVQTVHVGEVLRHLVAEAELAGPVLRLKVGIQCLKCLEMALVFSIL